MGSINNYGVFIRVLQGDATGTVDDRNPALPIIRNVPLFPQFRILEDAELISSSVVLSTLASSMRTPPLISAYFASPRSGSVVQGP